MNIKKSVLNTVFGENTKSAQRMEKLIDEGVNLFTRTLPTDKTDTSNAAPYKNDPKPGK